MHTSTDPLNHRRSPMSSMSSISPMRQQGLWPTPLYLYQVDTETPADGHELQSKMRVAESLAEFMGCTWAGPCRVGELERAHGTPCYLVPSEPIVGLEQARELGVLGVENLFGGVVPHPFTATKVIAHPLLHTDRSAPAGWSDEFCARTAGAVLPGYTAFGVPDALQAGALLLQGGSVRIKHPNGAGGVGHWVVGSGADLQRCVGGVDPGDLLKHGLVLERNLHQVTTCSVGQVQVGPDTISYHGTQCLTTNHRGEQVHGGSILHVVRGALGELLREDLLPGARRAVEQAICYHQAALACFSGMFASRSTYDVAQGVDDFGRSWSGVLEQSWHIGGASGAEVAALHAFDADPSLNRVVASTTERYADQVVVPDDAWLLYDGVDARVGRLVKYAQVAG